MGNENKITVNGIFNTSAGKIAILDFRENNRPEIGMILRNKKNAKWKITSVSLGKDTAKVLWGCGMETHSAEELKTGDSLFI